MFYKYNVIFFLIIIFLKAPAGNPIYTAGTTLKGA